MRFRYEFPWPAKFVHVQPEDTERTHFTGLRSTEELMEQMTNAEQESTFTTVSNDRGLSEMLDEATQMKRTHSDMGLAMSAASAPELCSDRSSRSQAGCQLLPVRLTGRAERGSRGSQDLPRQQRRCPR